jgi:hypothetical protein
MTSGVYLSTKIKGIISRAAPGYIYTLAQARLLKWRDSIVADAVVQL